MRLLGVNIPDQKRIEVALTSIYGVGLSSSQKILDDAGISPDTRTKDLTPEEVNKIKGTLEKGYTIEGELRQKVKHNIERLKSLGAYRGTRHAHRLPVRGQSTRRNSRTIRGNVRKTAGSGKRKLTLK